MKFRRLHIIFMALFASSVLVDKAGAAYTCNMVYTSCVAGYYLSGGSCTPCPAGSYCVGGTTAAQACSGTTQYQPSPTQSSCLTVDSGYYKSSNTAQTQCPVGYQSGPGAANQDNCKPTNCLAGQYWDGINTSCTTCAAGNYCTGVTNVTYGTRTTSTGATNCPAPEIGWVIGTRTGSSVLTECAESKIGSNISPYCSDGELTRNAIDESNWNTTITITSSLQAAAGSYVDG